MNEDIILRKLTEHDQRFDGLEGKLDAIAQRTLTAQDETLSVLRRLDEERVFTSAWVERMEREIEDHRREIQRIKGALKIT
ncbi:MAG: hypothetical protein V1656_02480 [Candidatus Jorgensenbacteria bacterium]